MNKNPRKPSGITGPIRFDSSGVSFEKIDFPESKEDVERHIAESFSASGGDLHFAISEIVQNKENDLDFSISTDQGPKFLELMEVAPLEGLGGSTSPHFQ